METSGVEEYEELRRGLEEVLKGGDGCAATLSETDKVSLALEILKARQLELDVEQARRNIEGIVMRRRPAPRTLRAVIPASNVKGMPMGAPLEIAQGQFVLTPTSNDPGVLFLSVEIFEFGPRPADCEPDEQQSGAPENDDVTETKKAS